MKTLRIINGKYFRQEEIILSPSDIHLAIKEYLESRYVEFQTGWHITIKSVAETTVVCSKWTGFSCPKCCSVMTSKSCQSRNCQNSVCEINSKIGQCCFCLSKERIKDY